MQPTVEQRAAFEAVLDPPQRLACVHAMPSGELILVSTQKGEVHTTTIRLKVDEIEVIERGRVVSVQH